MQKSIFAGKEAPQPKQRMRRTLPKTKKKLDEEILELINRRERQVLVHSCLYYHFNTSIITDAEYDKWSHQLYDIIVQNPVEFRNSVLHEEFKNFDGNTGMGLPYDSAFAMRVAERLIRK